MEVLYKRNGNVERNILILIPGDIAYRGIQVFFANVLKHINNPAIGFDLYFAGKLVEDELFQQLKNYNVGVIVGGLSVNSGKWKKKYISDVICLMKENTYDCVHVNSGMPWFNAMGILIAKKHRIHYRISHSHSFHLPEKSMMKRIYKKFLVFVINFLSTHKLACSMEAAIWMYGENGANNSVILNNGIEIEKYRFNLDRRIQMRNDYKITDEPVILHVGAFNNAKNQAFLLKMLSEILCIRKNTKLFLVGTGDNESKIKSEAEELGISESVVFVGASNRINEYMQMADMFVLPSKYEGLGLVNIEAQAAGLKCIVSDVVPRMVAVTDLVHFLSLEKGAKYWANYCHMELDGYSRLDHTDEIKRAGFSIADLVEKMTNVYVGNEYEN